MKLIRLAGVPLALALALTGCEDEPEDFSGVAGMGGGGAMGGAGGTGGRMSTDNSPALASAMGTVMADMTGRTMTAVTVATPMTAGGSSVSVSIPMGSQLLDEMGNPVTGMVEIAVDHYNVEPAEGGAQAMSMEGVTPGAGNAGVTTVSIASGDTLVVEIPGGADMTVNVPATTVDAMGRLVVMGTSVLVQAFDPAMTAESGWLDLFSGVLPAAMSGTHAVKLDLERLTYSVRRSMMSKPATLAATCPGDTPAMRGPCDNSAAAMGCAMVIKNNVGCGGPTGSPGGG